MKTWEYERRHWEGTVEDGTYHHHKSVTGPNTISVKNLV